MKNISKIELALFEDESKILRKEFDEIKIESLNEDEKIRFHNLGKRLRNIEIKISNYKNIHEKN